MLLNFPNLFTKLYLFVQQTILFLSLIVAGLERIEAMIVSKYLPKRTILSSQFSSFFLIELY